MEVLAGPKTSRSPCWVCLFTCPFLSSASVLTCGRKLLGLWPSIPGSGNARSSSPNFSQPDSVILQVLNTHTYIHTHATHMPHTYHTHTRIPGHKLRHTHRTHTRTHKQDTHTDAHTGHTRQGTHRTQTQTHTQDTNADAHTGDTHTHSNTGLTRAREHRTQTHTHAQTGHTRMRSSKRISWVVYLVCC